MRTFKWKDGNVRLTTVPLKPFSDHQYEIDFYIFCRSFSVKLTCAFFAYKKQQRNTQNSTFSSTFLIRSPLINNYDIFEEALIFRNFSKYFSYLGKYAMRDLVQKLPSGNPQRDVGTSDDTIAAVLATLNEVIKKHPEFSRFTHCFFNIFTRA